MRSGLVGQCLGVGVAAAPSSATAAIDATQCDWQGKLLQYNLPAKKGADRSAERASSHIPRRASMRESAQVSRVVESKPLRHYHSSSASVGDSATINTGARQCPSRPTTNHFASKRRRSTNCIRRSATAAPPASMWSDSTSRACAPTTASASAAGHRGRRAGRRRRPARCARRRRCASRRETVKASTLLPDLDQYTGPPLEFGRMEPTASDPDGAAAVRHDRRHPERRPGQCARRRSTSAASAR